MLGTALSPGSRGSPGLLLVGEFLTLEIIGVMVLTLGGQKPIISSNLQFSQECDFELPHHKLDARGGVSWLAPGPMGPWTFP